MSTDYSKLKNAELEALLKERGLPHNGKKAEMVARLAEHDALQTASSSTTAPSAAAATAAAPAALATADAATTEPAAAALAAGGTGTRAPNPVAVPNQEPAIDPSATADLSAAKDTTTCASAPVAPAAPAFTSNLNLAPTDIDAEIAKRKARAAKFGISDANNDAIKALERAKRFGTAPEAAAAGDKAEGVSRLDGALPERGGRKRGKAAVEDSWEDDGLKRRKGGAARGEKKKDEAGAGAGTGAKGTPSWMTEADRAAAEKRKAKFATASTAS